MLLFLLCTVHCMHVTDRVCQLCCSQEGTKTEALVGMFHQVWAYPCATVGRSWTWEYWKSKRKVTWPRLFLPIFSLTRWGSCCEAQFTYRQRYILLYCTTTMGTYLDRVPTTKWADFMGFNSPSADRRRGRKTNFCQHLHWNVNSFHHKKSLQIGAAEHKFRLVDRLMLNQT